MTYLEELIDAYEEGTHPMILPKHLEIFNNGFREKLEEELETERKVLLDTPALIALRLGIPDFGLAVSLEKERERLKTYDISGSWYDDLPRRGRFVPGEALPSFSKYTREKFETSFGINELNDRKVPTFNGSSYIPVRGVYYNYEGVPILVPAEDSKRLRQVVQCHGVTRVYFHQLLRPKPSGHVREVPAPAIVHASSSSSKKAPKTKQLPPLI